MCPLHEQAQPSSASPAPVRPLAACCLLPPVWAHLLPQLPHCVPYTLPFTLLRAKFAARCALCGRSGPESLGRGHLFNGLRTRGPAHTAEACLFLANRQPGPCARLALLSQAAQPLHLWEEAGELGGGGKRSSGPVKALLAVTLHPVRLHPVSPLRGLSALLCQGWG